MASVLFVSKPVAPPWNDSGKNLVRDLSRGLTRHRASLMVRPDSDPGVDGAARANVYGPEAGGFAPALTDQARVFAHLLGSRGHALWHFFFAPNPKSCLAGRLATSVRRMRSVHTVSSAPKDARAIVPKLFADVHVVLSRHTETRLRDAGLASDRLTLIPPAIEPLAPKHSEERERLRRELGLPVAAPIVIYPGDLEFGEGGPLVIEATQSWAARGALTVMACRAKTARAREAESRLRARVGELGLSKHVHFVGETPRIHDLLACADVVALPSTDLYAKMDYPLVLLEAMSLARPVIVARGSAAAELADRGGALAIEAHVDALASAVSRLFDDSSEREQLGAIATREVEERYAYPAMARAYESVYDLLLA